MTSEAPTYRLDEVVAAQVRGAFETAKQAAANLRNDAVLGKVARDENAPRIFVSPQHPGEKFLVAAGVLRWFPDPNSPSGKREFQREGDVWAKFAAGICATADPLVIDWCEAHSGSAESHQEYHKVKNQNPRDCTVPVGLCRDGSLPGVNTWAELKGKQVPTSRSGATIDPTIDLDYFLSAGLARASEASGQHYADEYQGSRFQATVEATAKALAERSVGGNRN